MKKKASTSRRQIIGATAQMLLSPKEYDYTPFTSDFKQAFLSTGKNAGTTEITKLASYEKHSIEANFPIVTFCYASYRGYKKSMKPEYFFDIFCSEAQTAILDLPNGAKVNAVYVHDMDVYKSFGTYKLAGKFGTFNNVDQSVKRRTMEEFVNIKKKGEKVSCWIIPVDQSYEWKILPSFFQPPAPKSFLGLWQKMQEYSYHKDDIDFFGIVVFPGKILIERLLVDCPKEYEVASTWMCQIKDTAISTGYKCHILTKAVPFEIDPNLIETYVDDEGKLVVRTVVGPMAIPYLKASAISSLEEEQKKIGIEGLVDACQAKYNLVMHPLFGKIILPRNLVWSAEATEIIFTFLFIAEDAINSLGRGIPFALAVHDGYNMIRLPLQLKTTASAVKLLIDNGVQLKYGVTDERQNEAEYVPTLPFKGYRIDGAVLDLKFCKPYEDGEEPQPDETFIQTQYVSHYYQQQPRNVNFIK